MRSEEDVLRLLRRLEDRSELLERDLSRFFSRDLDLLTRFGDLERDLETLPLGLLDGDLLLASNLFLPVFTPYLYLNVA
jgi:hypothetical protein